MEAFNEIGLIEISIPASVKTLISRANVKLPSDYLSRKCIPPLSLLLPPLDFSGSKIAEICNVAIGLVNQHTINSAYDLIQRAYLLTSWGRNDLYNQVLSCSMCEIAEHPPFDLELVNANDQLPDHEVELIPDPQSRTNSEENEIEADDEISIEDIHLSANFPCCKFPSSHLSHRARVRSDRIIDQFHLRALQTTSI
jgi:hypothetical protein